MHTNTSYYENLISMILPLLSQENLILEGIFMKRNIDFMNK